MPTSTRSSVNQSWIANFSKYNLLVSLCKLSDFIYLFFFLNNFFQVTNSIVSLNGYCLFKIARSLNSNVVNGSCSLHITLLCKMHLLRSMLMQHIICLHTSKILFFCYSAAWLNSINSIGSLFCTLLPVLPFQGFWLKAEYAQIRK